MFKPKIADVCAQYSVNSAISRRLPRKMSDAIPLDNAGAERLGNHQSVGYFVNNLEACDPENLLRGATAEQVSALTGVAEKSVNENVCVKVSAGRKIRDPFQRHDYRFSTSAS